MVRLKVLLALLAVVAAAAAAARAQQSVQPLPKVGSCPLGYNSSVGYCVPSASGNTCVNSSSNKREAIPKSGRSCPLGWFSSGSYCVKSR